MRGQTAVVLGIILCAGGTGGRPDVGNEIVVAGLEVVLRVCLAGVFDDLDRRRRDQRSARGKVEESLSV